MAAVLHSIDRENDFRRSVEFIGLFQDQKIRAKLGDPKRIALTHDMHFNFC